MKVMIVNADPVAGGALSAALDRAGAGPALGPVRTLSAAYHLAEHRRPDMALISTDFAVAEEIEVMKLLFRALGIAGVLTVADPARVPAAEARATDLGWKIVAETEAGLRGLLRAAAPSVQAPERPAPAPAIGRFDPARMLLIGASTGGVDALVTVLRDFPANCPPTVIVQHTGAGFSEGLVRLLNRQCAPRVVEARNRQLLEPGMVFVAPGVAEHLVISAREPRLQLRPDGPVSGHRPSIDRLFQSALPYAGRVTAALLTGMGRDGAQGMADLRRAGAFTVAQDRESSVVYGMPRVAVDLGGVVSQLPLTRIGAAILASCRRRAA